MQQNKREEKERKQERMRGRQKDRRADRNHQCKHVKRQETGRKDRQAIRRREIIKIHGEKKGEAEVE